MRITQNRFSWAHYLAGSFSLIWALTTPTRTSDFISLVQSSKTVSEKLTEMTKRTCKGNCVIELM